MKRKLRVGLGIFAMLALILVIGGFALWHGYLMHFLLDDKTISHDQFYTLYQEAEAGQPINLSCAQGEWTVGWVYLYEVHCFSSEAAMDAYMNLHDGSS